MLYLLIVSGNLFAMYATPEEAEWAAMLRDFQNFSIMELPL